MHGKLLSFPGTKFLHNFLQVYICASFSDNPCTPPTLLANKVLLKRKNNGKNNGKDLGKESFWKGP